MSACFGTLLMTAAAAGSFWIAALSAAPAQTSGKKGKAAGGGRRTAVPDDNTGFTPIFDRKSLANWDGEPGFWRVEGGAITGETTAEKPLRLNTFVVWRGGKVRDFELKLEYRISETGNSGVQYRSAALPDVGKWVLKGYQADIDGRNNYTGMLYEERARGFLSQRGQFVRMEPGGTARLIGSPGEPDALKALIKTGDWNQVHIIARGNVIAHVINGRVMAVFVDDDPEGRAAEGLLGLQLHQGPPMKVEFRGILLKSL